MTSDERVLKHLEFIHSTMHRMHAASVTVKTVSVGFFGLVLTLLSETLNVETVWPFLPFVAVFWFLDAFYLYNERLFKCLYDDVRQLQDTDFSMRRDQYRGFGQFMSSAASLSIVPFYLLLSGGIILLQALGGS